MSLATLRAAVPVIALALGAAGGWTARGWLADRDQSAAAAVDAIEARRIESARTRNIQDAADDTTRRLRAAQADAVAARAAADGLRIAAHSAAGRACEAAGDPEATASAADLLADVLSELDAMAGEYAAAADAAHAAAAGCVSAVE